MGGTTVQPTTLQPTDYAGIVNSYNKAAQEACATKVKAQSDMLSAAFGIPTSILGGWAKGGFNLPKTA